MEETSPRRPTRSEITEQESYLLERQRVFRVVADEITAALARCPDVESIALIGSVARPLSREVPRFAPYRQLRLPIAHECKDVDLAVWVSRLDGLDKLRRERGNVVRDMVARQGHAPADHEIEIFLLEPGTNRYHGRLCFYRQCPADKPACLVAECGREPFLRQHDDFSLLPEAIRDNASVRLFDRNASGILARATDLPLRIVDEA